MKVVWSAPAAADLDALVRHIAADSVAAALSQDSRIREAVSRLAEYPHMGPQGLARGTRELVITGTPYIAIYQVGPDACEILTVLHGARQWPPRDR